MTSTPPPGKPPRKSNRLAQETSPYLRQHAQNPVDWYPWGDEALRRAKREEKPIFLSIGYSACHWCHVMERESFEDEETAKVMNEHFVNVKVDREERQDLDHIYMSAVQVMTQHGGWPMSVFLTPDLDPFYGGTYFPNEDRMGMPSFKRILAGVATAWKTKRAEVQQSAKQLTAAIDEIGQATLNGQTPAKPSADLFDRAADSLYKAFDTRYGGLGQAPKFFHSMSLRAALRVWKRTADRRALAVATVTLDRILRGGICDQLGGGFHRYSTDEQWLAPHFEKMLYDNALLVPLFLEGYQATGEVEYSHTARETLDWVLREMTQESGGFFATQDADTEGEEGKFYVWSEAEVRATLGGSEKDTDLADLFCRVYDVTAGGNWEGKNILRRVAELEGDEKHWQEDNLALARRKLFAERAKRPAPFRDEKILVSWNGLMIDAMAKASQVFADERYRDAARAAARFLLERVARVEGGRLFLYHSWKDGNAKLNAYLDDYACFVDGLVSLYEADGDVSWLAEASRLADTMIDEFRDIAGGGFFFTGKSHEKLITRAKDAHDGATPSGLSMAVTALLRLGRLTENDGYRKAAESALETYEPLMRLAPTATSQLLVALGYVLDKPREIVVIAGNDAEETEAVLEEIHRRFLPNAVLAVLPAGADRARAEKIVPLFRDRKAEGGRTTTYVCESYACRTPIVGVDGLAEALA